MDRVIRLINEYCEKEFGSPGNFSNMDHIELAYKPDEETGLAGIEAYADLETFRIVKEQDGRVVDEQLFNMSLIKISEPTRRTPIAVCGVWV